MQHFPKNMLAADKWCNKCKAFTSHRLFNGQMSNVCIRCQEKSEAEHQARIEAQKLQPVQESLFA